MLHPILKKDFSLDYAEEWINYTLLHELSIIQKEEVFRLQIEKYRKFHQAINP